MLPWVWSVVDCRRRQNARPSSHTLGNDFAGGEARQGLRILWELDNLEAVQRAHHLSKFSFSAIL